MNFINVTVLYLSLTAISVYSLKEAVSIVDIPNNRDSSNEVKDLINKTGNSCIEPFPKRFPISEEFDDKTSIFFPPCVVLYRCDDQGCCDRNKACAPAQSGIKYVNITVLEKIAVPGRRKRRNKYHRLTFQNHTLCEMVSLK
nr:venom protein [Lampona murina]